MKASYMKMCSHFSNYVISKKAMCLNDVYYESTDIENSIMSSPV